MQKSNQMRFKAQDIICESKELIDEDFQES